MTINLAAFLLWWYNLLLYTLIRHKLPYLTFGNTEKSPGAPFQRLQALWRILKVFKAMKDKGKGDIRKDKEAQDMDKGLPSDANVEGDSKAATMQTGRTLFYKR